jgi:Zn-dependent protease with chaperone function
MNKAERIGQGLGRHPLLLKLIVWGLLAAVFMLIAFIVWREMSRGRYLVLLVSGALAAWRVFQLSTMNRSSERRRA